MAGAVFAAPAFLDRSFLCNLTTTFQPANSSIKFHQERNLNFVLLTLGFGATRRVCQRCRKCTLYRTAKAAGCHAASSYVTKRAVAVNRCQDGSFHSIHARLVHFSCRRRIRSAWLRQGGDTQPGYRRLGRWRRCYWRGWRWWCGRHGWLDLVLCLWWFGRRCN